MVNILTGGAITVKHMENFIEYVNTNEFNAYHSVEKTLNTDWNILEFPEVYQILKAVKDFVNKDKKIIDYPSFSDKTSQSSKVMGNSKTTLEILEDIRESEATPNAKSEDSEYEEKWKQTRLKIIKKLLVIFDFFRKNIHDSH